MSGATGLLANDINGTYTSTEESLNGKTVYSKLVDASKCMYFAANKRWCVSVMSAEVKAGKNAPLHAWTENGLPHPIIAKKWQVGDGWGPMLQPLVLSILVSLNICSVQT